MKAWLELTDSSWVHSVTSAGYKLAFNRHAAFDLTVTQPPRPARLLLGENKRS